MNDLPRDFTARMQELLGTEEFEAFMASYQEEKAQGLRFNPLKGENLLSLAEKQFSLEKIPWAREGYYYNRSRPGKHLYHEAGMYYIQEPSAMAVAQLLEVKPGDWVLDLCAAPGGKTTQIAGELMGRGILVCNEIHPSRAKILSQNVERMGISGAVVTSEDSEKLAKRFGPVFDKIVIDAPCSGEGMFRKDEEARLQWSREHVRECAERQARILDNGAAMVKSGGRLVYSTCTFSPEENEETILAFLDRHSEFQVETPGKLWLGFSPGKPQWSSDPEHAREKNLQATIRIWPHKARGEGHYMAVLKKEGTAAAKASMAKQDSRLPVDREEWQNYEAFIKDTLKEAKAKELLGRARGDYLLFGDQLYLLPEGAKELFGKKGADGLRILRPGLHLGEFKKKRFEPSHGLALFLKPEEVKQCRNLTIQDPEEYREAVEYIKGMSLNTEAARPHSLPYKGWVLIAVDGMSLGWVKAAGNALKNHYPKGLRWVSE
ncbi:MAG: RsmF rRNA methyltransferase first C-terminal domain-containing protein [Lachnospiraceae bacterium]|nr:RsmF rRNA methyltransferase first C-terminal domain-containing protein [Lachnospiraceae bacterium]